MKKRLLAITLAVMMILAFIPFGSALAATYSAELLGQMDMDASSLVDEWGLGDWPGNSVTFSLGQNATIKLEFTEPVKFSGNWTGIATDIPVASDEDAEATGGRIVAFKLDGVDLGYKAVPLINRDNSGFLTIDIARQWGGSYDVYNLAGMEPFSTLEITFAFPGADGEVAAPTGVSFLLFPALGAFVLGTAGAFIARKKMK